MQSETFDYIRITFGRCISRSSTFEIAALVAPSQLRIAEHLNARRGVSSRVIIPHVPIRI